MHKELRSAQLYTSQVLVNKPVGTDMLAVVGKLRIFFTFTHVVTPDQTTILPRGKGVKPLQYAKLQKSTPPSIEPR
jgi:hypothetical protein